MKKHFLMHSLMGFWLVLSATASSESLNFNFVKSTPVGSWQLREDITTDHKGRQTVSQMRSSLVGEEMRDGEQYYWIEMVIDNFKIKKGKRKPTGDTAIMKSLVAAGAFNDDPANAVNNLREFGKEIIVQNGDQDPMRMSGAGGMADSLMKAFDAKITYEYEVAGKEDVSVKAGNFKAQKMMGNGSTEMKVFFKKISVTSTNTAWISSGVPFGLVKSEGESNTNGKKSTHSSELLEYGTSGGVSRITKPPQDMPEMPKLKDLFGV